MATTLYQQSIPVMVKYLKNMSAMLQKGAKFCDEKGMKQEEMLTYRLISDMRGIPYQVQSCSNTAKFLASRLGAPNVPLFEDNEETFEQLQARITKTIEILESVDPDIINGKENEEVLMETKNMGTFRFTGQRYVSEYVIPNFHFHLTSAYCIMRTQGVPLGAFDYLKDVFEKA
ncbi:transcription factor [Fusarium austroafricanum]|uniref:Transcription factor n=1 Tax=Fusarium austroafricanum TaxID=2364996 RepID=A0A8H4KRC8_9HYPO|nr:transcription factor [Fusarium austroafricanum]